jgi:hypothetical protein
MWQELLLLVVLPLEDPGEVFFFEVPSGALQAYLCGSSLF